jgi:hypothetical protein
VSRHLLVLSNEAIRAKALKWVQQAPPETRLTFQAPRRSLDQNAALWSALTDIAAQRDYHSVKLSPDDWKLLFMDALKREVRMVPNLDGNGFVSLGRSSSDLSREEFSGLLDVIYEWSARNGVTLTVPRDQA